MGWGGFLDKLMGVLPIQKRKERWKNELDNLERERKNLLNGEANEKTSTRLAVIIERINYLQQLFRNATQD